MPPNVMLLIAYERGELGIRKKLLARGIGIWYMYDGFRFSIHRIFEILVEKLFGFSVLLA